MESRRSVSLGTLKLWPWPIFSFGREWVSAARWAEALGSEINASASNGEADEREAYFRAALAALERLLLKDGRITRSELDEREHAWEHAYLSTPHGQPVKLR